MPDADGLTPTARKILAIMCEHGDWVTRADLANKIGHEKLSPYHIRVLERLFVKGLIEVRRYRTASWNLSYQYRAKR